jgi:predicted Zn-dependent protease
MKKLRFLCIVMLLFFGCAHNPLTGKNTMAFVSNSTLFPTAFSQYKEFLNENEIVKGTDEAAMVTRVGQKIAAAAQKWLVAEGSPQYLKDYRWEYTLVNDKQINAWCMPGGKIVVYTGILPVTKNEDGLAIVMGHEVAHALLNHGQQRMSAGFLQQLGATALGMFTDSQLLMSAYGISTNLLGTLPFSRKNESESDHYGLILAAIAGYNPSEAPLFWQRMSAMSGGSSLEFLSTHPSHDTRIKDLQGWVPEARKKAAEINRKK